MQAKSIVFACVPQLHSVGVRGSVLLDPILGSDTNCNNWAYVYLAFCPTPFSLLDVVMLL
jgi:hypothetical protein